MYVPDGGIANILRTLSFEEQINPYTVPDRVETETLFLNSKKQGHPETKRI